MLDHLKLNIQFTAPGEIPEGAKRVTNEMLDELIEQDKKEGEKKWKEHKATLKNKFVIDKSIKQRFQVGCYESTDWESIHELLLKDEVVDRAPLNSLEQAKVFFIKRKQMTESQFDELGYSVRLVEPKVR